MSSFKHHFGVLRDHLLALLVQQDRNDADIDKVTNQLGDTVLTELEQPATLGDVFETVNQCLVWIQPTGSGRSKGHGDGRGSDEESESDSDEEGLQPKVEITKCTQIRWSICHFQTVLQRLFQSCMKFFFFAS